GPATHGAVGIRARGGRGHRLPGEPPGRGDHRDRARGRRWHAGPAPATQDVTQLRGRSMRISSPVAVVVAIAALTLSACSKDSNTSSGNAPASGSGAVGVDFPRADSDFWNAYNGYVPSKAQQLGVKLAGTTNSQNNIQTLIGNVDSLVAQGAKALVIAPQDTGAIGPKLDELAGK